MIHKALERQNCPALRASVDANGGEEVIWDCHWGGSHVLGRVEDGYLKTADGQWQIPLDQHDDLARHLEGDALSSLVEHLPGLGVPIELNEDGSLILWGPSRAPMAIAGPQWTCPGDLAAHLRRLLPGFWRRSLWADISMDLRMLLPQEDLDGVRYEEGERRTVIYLLGEREVFSVTLRDNYYGYTLGVLISESGVQDQYRINYGTDDTHQARQAIVDRLKWRIDGRFNMPAS